MTVHCTDLPHPSLSQSQWVMKVPICSPLFPWVPEEIKTDFQFLSFFLSLSLPLFFPHPPTFLSSFSFFLARDNVKVFSFLFFFWRPFKHKLSIWENRNPKTRKKKWLASDVFNSWKQWWASRIPSSLPPPFLFQTSLLSFLPSLLPLSLLPFLPSLFIECLSSCQRIYECFSHSNSCFW